MSLTEDWIIVSMLHESYHCPTEVQNNSCAWITSKLEEPGEKKKGKEQIESPISQDTQYEKIANEDTNTNDN